MRRRDDPTPCYLCGQPIGRTESSKDHVPPLRFFPKAFRAALRVPLLTLKTHPECHKPWRHDEEYFYTTLLPHALSGPLGKQLAEDFRRALATDKTDRHRKLAETVRRQFQEHPSGLILPGGKLVQKFDGVRLTRVVWKIVRGLYFNRNGNRVLPDATPFMWNLWGPMDPLAPDYVIGLMGEPSSGRIPEVLDYKVVTLDEPPGECWLMRLWERYVFFLMFHRPGICTCALCRPETAQTSLDSPLGSRR